MAQIVKPSTNGKPIPYINPVYQTIQEPTDSNGDTGLVGKILYANKYSGLSPVGMPVGLQEVFNTPVTGKNILIQLESLVDLIGVNGPWYVDCRENIIHIHNRAFLQNPKRTFVYKAEGSKSGSEIINASFQVRTVTRTVHATVSGGIGPNKQLILNSTKAGDDLNEVFSYDVENRRADYTKLLARYQEGKISEQDFRSGVSVINSYGTSGSPRPETISRTSIERSDNTMVDTTWSPNTYGAKITSDELEEVIKQTKAIFTTKRNDKYLGNGYNKTYSSNSYHQVIEKIIRDSPDEAIDREVNEAVSHISNFLTGGNKASAEKFKREFDSAVANGTLEAFLKANVPQAEYNYHIIDNRDSPDIKMGDLAYGTYKTAIYENQRDYTPTASIVPGGSPPARYKSVKVADQIKVPQLDFLVMAFQRRGYKEGKDNSARDWGAINIAVNKAGQRVQKITERKLTANCTVLGDPHLRTSQVIEILNVGKRWSGAWYIKKCEHIIDQGNGYICKLELIKNNSMISANSSQVRIDGAGLAPGNSEAVSKSILATLSKVDNPTALYYAHLDPSKRARALVAMEVYLHEHPEDTELKGFIKLSRIDTSIHKKSSDNPNESEAYAHGTPVVTPTAEQYRELYWGAASRIDKMAREIKDAKGK